jgi:catechol 2,3-dioxygenase-like lactoylglutathione lyase family enzyme
MNILAPVSRGLAVRDAARSVAFYRDVLGFEVRRTHEPQGVLNAAELVRGPARLQVEIGDLTLDSTGRERPRGTAILCFLTDDVAGFRGEVVARGGAPTELEKVNGIKLELFELRDPDGHTLWFGQSFDQPDAPPKAAPMLERAIPELPLNQVAFGVEYYRDMLGFSINYQQHDLAVMDRDQVRVVLIRRTERHQGISSAYVYVADADRLHAEFTAKGAMVMTEPVSRPWGLREFKVADTEANELTFGQPFE